MGFRNNRTFNEAMLAKQGWRLLMNPGDYWARFLKGIYFPKTSFLQASRGSHASWAWLSLLHGRNLLKEGLRWQVENGKKIDFWNDAWVPMLPRFKISSTRPENCSISKVADVIDARTGKWDVPKLASLVIPEEMEAISSIPLPMMDRDNMLVWHFNTNGTYSVKSGYRVAHNQFISQLKEKPETSFKPKEVWKVFMEDESPKQDKEHLVESLQELRQILP